MANEKRLIDANALRDTIEHIDWYHIDKKGHLAHGANSAVHTPFYKAESIYKAIENAPTVDAVEVVRCNDCKHMVTTPDGLRLCSVWCAINGMGDEGFCNYGERKDNG